MVRYNVKVPPVLSGATKLLNSFLGDRNSLTGTLTDPFLQGPSPCRSRFRTSVLVRAGRTPTDPPVPPTSSHPYPLPSFSLSLFHQSRVSYVPEDPVKFRHRSLPKTRLHDVDDTSLIYIPPLNPPPRPSNEFPGNVIE